MATTLNMSVEAATAAEPSVAMARSGTASSVETASAVEPAISVASDVTLTMSAGVASADEPGMFLGQNEWSLNNNATVAADQAVTNIELTHDELRLWWQTHITKLSDIRELNDNAGEVRKITDSDGGWTAEDTSGNDSNTHSIKPPVALQPTLVPDTYHVRQYQEVQRSEQSGFTTRAFARLLRAEPRDPEDSSNVLTETQDTDDEWKFEFAHGTIAPTLVQRADQGNQVDVRYQLNLDDSQVEVVLESVTRTDAVSVEEIPDGDDFVRDTNSDNRNTVTITKATNARSDYIPTDGADYAVRSWTVRQERPGRWVADMLVREL